MSTLRHVVIVRAHHSLKVDSLRGKLYLRLLNRLINDVNKAIGPQIFYISILDKYNIAIDLIITDKLESREDSFVNLLNTRELTEEELSTFHKEFKKHLGIKLTEKNSEYIEKWTI